MGEAYQIVTAEVNGGELRATLIARMERCDYGVSGSPDWFEAVDLRIDSITVDDEHVDPDRLAERFGGVAARGMRVALEKAADPNEWVS